MAGNSRRLRGIWPVVALIAAIGCYPHASLAEPVEVTARAVLERPETPFHRPAVYTLVVEAPLELEVVLPKMNEDIEGLEVRQGQYDTRSLEDERREIRQSYILDPIQVQTYVLPPLEVTWDEEGKTTVPAMAFRVRELTSEEAEQASRFEDIVLPGKAMPEGRPWGWIAAGATAVLVLAAAVGYLLWRRRAQEMAVPPPPPWDVALRRLHELAERHLPDAGRYERYYVDLSAILRYYIEDRFGLHAPEQTTPEFLDAASESGQLTEGQQQFLSTFLEHCDRVKFARYEPSRQEMDEGYGLVEQFVHETECVPEAAEAPAETPPEEEAPPAASEGAS